MLRNALSRSLGREVPAVWATLARFGCNLPFTIPVLLVLTVQVGWPCLDAVFWGWVALTALCQSLANLCLVAAFARIEFGRAVVLHKLEVAMAPFVGMVLFGELPTVLGLVGIGLCAVGTIWLNALARPGAGVRALLRLDRGSGFALGSASFVVLASFFLKEGTIAFVRANPGLPAVHFAAAMHGLVHAAWLQVVVLVVFLAVRRPQLFLLLRTHKGAMLRLGFAAAISSICWFWAYSLALVAYVKALGQIEVVVAAIVSHRVLRERSLVRQLPAMALVMVGILLVLFGSVPH